MEGDACPVCGYNAEIERSIKVLMSLKGVGRKRAERLYRSGFTDLEKIRKARIEDLMSVSGISRETARKIKEQVESRGVAVCGNCGAFIPADAATCPKCGAVLEVEEAEEVAETVEGDVLQQTTSGLAICASCGAFIPADAATCPKCGAVLEVEEEAVVEERVEEERCPVCGNPLEEGATSCPVCGAVLVEEEEVAEAEGAEAPIIKLGEDVAICGYCGAIIPAASERCPICDANLVEVGVMEVETAESPDDVLKRVFRVEEIPTYEEEEPGEVSVRICPVCGAVVVNADTCPICNSEVPEVSPIAEEEREVSLSDVLGICPMCGALMGSQDTTCPVCGAEVHGTVRLEAVQGGDERDEFAEAVQTLERLMGVPEEGGTGARSEVPVPDEEIREEMERVDALFEGLLPEEGEGEIAEGLEEIEEIIEGAEETAVEEAPPVGLEAEEGMEGLEEIEELIGEEEGTVETASASEAGLEGIEELEEIEAFVEEGAEAAVPSIAEVESPTGETPQEIGPPSEEIHTQPAPQRRVEVAAPAAAVPAPARTPTAVRLPERRGKPARPAVRVKAPARPAKPTTVPKKRIAVRRVALRWLLHDLGTSQDLAILLPTIFLLLTGTLSGLIPSTYQTSFYALSQMISYMFAAIYIAAVISNRRFTDREGIMKGAGLAAAIPLPMVTALLLPDPMFVLAASIIPFALGIRLREGTFYWLPAFSLALATSAYLSLAPLAMWNLLLPAIPAAVVPAALHMHARYVETRAKVEIRLGDEMLVKKAYSLAERRYTRAAEAIEKVPLPGKDIPWYSRGVALLREGKYMEAVRALKRAVAINPRSEIAWNNMGIAYAKMGKLDEAKMCFKKAIEIKPDYKYAWNNMGNVYARAEDYETALRYYERALSIDPNYRDALINKSYVLVKMGEYEEAARIAQKLISLST